MSVHWLIQNCHSSALQCFCNIPRPAHVLGLVPAQLGVRVAATNYPFHSLTPRYIFISPCDEPAPCEKSKQNREACMLNDALCFSESPISLTAIISSACFFTVRSKFYTFKIHRFLSQDNILYLHEHPGCYSQVFLLISPGHSQATVD